MFFSTLASILSLLLSNYFFIPMLSAEEKPPIELPEVVIVGKDLSAFQSQTEKENPPEMPFGLKIQPTTSYEKIDATSISQEARTAPPTKGISCLFSTPLTADIASGFQPDEAKFKLGLYNFQQKKYPEAINQFQLLIKASDKSYLIPSAYYWLGESHLAMDNKDKALDYFLKVVNTYPSDKLWAYASYSAGWIHLTNGEYEKALMRFQPIKELSRKEEAALTESARFFSGQAFFRQKKYREAAQDFASLVDLSGFQTPYRPQALYWQAESLYRTKEFSQAAVMYQQFIKDYPNNPLVREARYGLAWSMLQEGKYQQALSAFQDWARDFPQSRFLDSVALGKIKAILGSDDWALALEEFNKLSAKSPTGPWTDQATLELGFYAFQKKQYPEANRLLDNLINNFSDSPNIPLAHFLRGECDYHTGDYQKALYHYQYLRDHDAKGYPAEAALFKGGLTFLRLKKYDQAREKLKEFIERYPESELVQEATFWLAEAYFQGKDYQRARETYLKINKEGKRGPEAIYGLGWTFFKLEDWKKAAEYFSSFTFSYPNSQWRPDAMFHLAESKANLKEYKEANRIFYELATQYPHSELAAKSHFQVGLDYLKIGKFEEAKKIFLQVQSNFPQSEVNQEAKYRIGETLFKEGKYPEARKELEAFIRESPKHPLLISAWLKMADSFYNEQDYPSALKYYQEIIKRFPSSKESIEAQYGALLTLYQKGDFSAFLTGAREFAFKHPQHSLSYTLNYQMAEHLMAQKDYAAALTVYTDLIRKNPKHELAAEAQFRLAEILLQTGKYSEAISAYHTLLSNYPNSNLKAEALYNLGKTYSQLKDYSRALDYYQQLLTFYPNSQLVPATMYACALTLWGLQKKGEAAIYLGKLVTIYPDSPFQNRSNLMLGLYYQEKQENNKAIVQFKKATQAQDHDIAAEAQFGFGQTLAALGETQQAVSELLKIGYLFPEKKELVTKALFEAGGYYEKLGKWEEAIAVYRKIVEQNQDQSIQNAAQNKIQQISKKRQK